jgi:hypothetical protein
LELEAAEMKPISICRTLRRVGRDLAAAMAVALMTATARAVESAPERDQSLLVVGYGVAGVFNAQKASGALFEWRSPELWRSLRGWAALNVATQGAYFAGVGLYYGVPLGRRWEVGVSSGPGYFRPDRRLNLGDSVEFRSHVECDYRLRSGQRIGLRFGHVSNGGLGRVNPGSEFVQLVWQVPLDRVKAALRRLRFQQSSGLSGGLP